MNIKMLTTPLIAASLVVSASAVIAEEKPLAESEPGSTVLLNGQVKSIDGNEFQLDFGGDTIEVDLDGWAWEDDVASYLKIGEQVSVGGTIEDGLLETRSLDATNIYVAASTTYYSIDDSSPAYLNQYENSSTQGSSQEQSSQDRQKLTNGAFVSVKGIVASISGRELTLDSGNMSVKVDTSDMLYNPLEKDIGESVQKGDRVYAYGEVNEAFLSGKVISASSIVKMMDASKKSL